MPVGGVNSFPITLAVDPRTYVLLSTCIPEPPFGRYLTSANWFFHTGYTSISCIILKSYDRPSNLPFANQYQPTKSASVAPSGISYIKKLFSKSEIFGYPS